MSSKRKTQKYNEQTSESNFFPIKFKLYFHDDHVGYELHVYWHNEINIFYFCPDVHVKIVKAKSGSLGMKFAPIDLINAAERIEHDYKEILVGLDEDGRELYRSHIISKEPILEEHT